MAEKLLEKEVIFKEDLELIFGKRTFEKDVNALLKEQEDESSKSSQALPQPPQTEEKKQDA